MNSKSFSCAILVTAFIVSCQAAKVIDEVNNIPTVTLPNIEETTQVEQEATNLTQPQQVATPTKAVGFEMEIALLPTLSPEVRDETYFDLMGNNGGCDLPCWWGLVPGVSTWPEATKLYSNFTNEISTHEVTIPVERRGEKYQITLQTILFELPESVGFEIGSVEFRVRSNGVIEGIRPSTLGSGDKYTIESMLVGMKSPSTLLVNITEVDLTIEHYYAVNIYLHYAQEGIYANYGDTVSVNSESLEVACFGGSSALYLWNPADDFQLDELLTKNVASNLVDTQTAFGLSSDEFIRLVLENGQECFSILVNDDY